MIANHPPRELIRAYLGGRRTDTTPPMSPDEIRTLLGWKLIEGERQAAQKGKR